jgi:hypothetical protein
VPRGTHLDKFAKPRAVIIPDSLSVTKGLKDGVGLQDLLFHPGGDAGGDGAEVLEDKLGSFRLFKGMPREMLGFSTR